MSSHNKRLEPKGGRLLFFLGSDVRSDVSPSCYFFIVTKRLAIPWAPEFLYSGHSMLTPEHPSVQLQDCKISTDPQR